MHRRWPLPCVCLLLVAGCERGPEPTFQADEPAPASRAASPVVEEPARDAPAAGEGEAPEPPPRALQRRPTSPDPADGTFSLDEALADLPGQGTLRARIRTSLGALTCTLYEDKAPETVANFVGLARGLRPWWDAREAAWQTKPYFDGTSFHRVIPDFMIQGGDHMRDGTGDVGYTFDDELHPSLSHDGAGQLCMANKGPNTNSAQFFITDGPAPHLDRMKSYTIFGDCEPLETIARIARVPQTGPPHNRPKEAVDIEQVRITRE